MITVITKHACGNDVVGDMKTVVQFYPDNTPIKEVFTEMKIKGTWDIVIPRDQPVTEDN